MLTYHAVSFVLYFPSLKLRNQHAFSLLHKLSKNVVMICISILVLTGEDGHGGSLPSPIVSQ